MHFFVPYVTGSQVTFLKYHGLIVFSIINNSKTWSPLAKKTILKVNTYKIII